MKISIGVALALLGLTLLCAAEVLAVPISPGTVTIQGQMLWNDFGAPPVFASWIDLPVGICVPDNSGNLQGGMFARDDPRGRVIGIADGTHDLPLGSYETLWTGFVGHTADALDLTIQPTSGTDWLGSQNLLLEVRSSSSSDVYWAYSGPFTSQPPHAYVQFPSPQVGYEFRLTVVPEPSSVLVVLSGLSLFCYRSTRRLRRRGQRCN